MDFLALFQSFVWRPVAADFPLDRASLHVGTLFGYAWNWSCADGSCDEVKVDPAVLAMDVYRRNPLYRVIEYEESFQSRINGQPAGERSPLLTELAEQGFTEYMAVPLRAGGA